MWRRPRERWAAGRHAPPPPPPPPHRAPSKRGKEEALRSPALRGLRGWLAGWPAYHCHGAALVGLLGLTLPPLSPRLVPSQVVGQAVTIRSWEFEDGTKVGWGGG